MNDVSGRWWGHDQEAAETQLLLSLLTGSTEVVLLLDATCLQEASRLTYAVRRLPCGNAQSCGSVCIAGGSSLSQVDGALFPGDF